MKFLTQKQLGIALSDTTIVCAATFIVCLGLEVWKKGAVAAYVNMNELLTITLIVGVLAVVITPDQNQELPNNP